MIFALQELDNEAVSLLQKYFDDVGYSHIHTGYCPDKYAFKFMYAYNPNYVKISDIKQIYFTESGLATSDEERLTLSKEEKIRRHCETEFEKSAYIVTVNNKYLLVNTYQSLTNPHKLAAMTKLTHALSNETLPIIIVGDFNMFDMDNSNNIVFHEQINILMDNNYTWITKDLLDRGIKATFIGFPYDIDRFLTKENKEELALVKQENN